MSFILFLIQNDMVHNDPVRYKFFWQILPMCGWCLGCDKRV